MEDYGVIIQHYIATPTYNRRSFHIDFHNQQLDIRHFRIQYLPRIASVGRLRYTEQEDLYLDLFG